LIKKKGKDRKKSKLRGLHLSHAIDRCDCDGNVSSWDVSCYLLTSTDRRSAPTSISGREEKERGKEEKRKGKNSVTTAF